MPCVYSSQMVKNYRICPIRIEIIHGKHRVVQIYTWAGPMCKFVQLHVCHELFLNHDAQYIEQNN